jgi:hypothetical protein
MKLRQLINELICLSQQEGFDPDGEVLISLRDKNGDNLKDLPITETDWFWADIFDKDDTKKIVVIQAQMTE